jgi:hypothetical protein
MAKGTMLVLPPHLIEPLHHYSGVCLPGTAVKEAILVDNFTHHLHRPAFYFASH